MKFIDSTIIAYAFYNNERKDACRCALRTGGITNTLNLIEAFIVLERITNRQHASACIKSLLKSNLTFVAVTNNLLFESLKRTKKYSLHFADLLHYTTALLTNCSAVVSYDKDFENMELVRVEP